MNVLRRNDDAMKTDAGSPITTSLNKVKKILYIFTCSFLLIITQSKAQKELQVTDKSSAFKLAAAGKAATIIADEKEAEVVHIAAAAFKDDIRRVTGIVPVTINSKQQIPADFAVIAGTAGSSSIIDDLIKSKKLPNNLQGQWETYYITLVKNPTKNIKQALVIAGSDRRGTAYGLFELSRMIGVHPFYWWADITPKHKDAIYIQAGSAITSHPSVKYRGIFLNDEDWGLQPWAAKMMDKDVKDIGPRTYEKIFELLLRLKANYIWPAMHPCTKAFWFYPEDAKLADKYAIVLGASHCEPMLRNNVFEWAENYEHEYKVKPGEWRYDLNKNQIYNYWEDRVKEAKNTEAVYTVGMRGIHDGSMPGPKSVPEKVKLLEQIIQDQRQLLTQQSSKPAEAVPQIFCPYKEVLSLYQAGMKLPDDVTIVWADDNHGYIRQLSNPEEQKRSGRSGVYYHLSYWGRPQDYLWLSSISPSLISYEMTKAYDYTADRLWVFNVGDIKPAEAEIQFALELAWDVNKWKPERAHEFAKQWATEIFGAELADDIASIKNEYYRLAAFGKPEHINGVAYTNEQMDKRLKDYATIAEKAQVLKARVLARLQDAYYELVLYPVQGAKLMNEKIFYAKKSNEAKADKTKASAYTLASEKAYNTIQQMTSYYNTGIQKGKWNGIISSHPRDQKAFEKPAVAINVSNVTTPSSDPTPEAAAISIAANKYNNKKEGEGSSITNIVGLGTSGTGVTTLPLTSKAFTKEDINKAPYVEYKVKPGTGNKKIIVKCLPTFAVYKPYSMQYGISIDGEEPKMINIQTEADTKQWDVNVLRGYSQGETNYTFSNDKEVTIRIYLPQPGLVINTIEIK